jgi:hypothetical protein
MNMKKQTAVEWFSDNVWKLKSQLENKEITLFQFCSAYFKRYEQAKEIENEQITEAFKHGELPPLFVNYNAEEYYNETYKKDK